MAGNFGKLDEFHSERESWECYLERCEQFFAANDIADDKKKVAVLLSSIGSKVYSELRDAVAPRKPAALSFTELDETLNARYNPECTVILQRYRFHTRIQQESESVSEFVSALRRLASKGRFEGFLNEALRDQFVCGIRDGGIQKKLLGTSDLSFDTAVKTALAMEAAYKDYREMNRKALNSSDIHQVKSKRPLSTLECFCCGVKGHMKNECVHKEKVCYLCNKVGHLAKVCMKARRQKPGNGGKKGGQAKKSRQSVKN